MKLKHLPVVIFLLLLSLVVSQKKVLADQYEEEVVKDITLDKFVKNPNTGQWVDNLFASDYKFVPQDSDIDRNKEPEFKIIIRNSGDQDLDNIYYKDIMPHYLEYLSGDLEETFSLKVNESREFYFKTRTVKQEQMPDDAGLVCVVNTAQAEVEGQLDKDTAQICIEGEKGEVAGVKTYYPPTGPVDNLILLLGSAGLALTGGVLIGKSKQNIYQN